MFNKKSTKKVFIRAYVSSCYMKFMQTEKLWLKKQIVDRSFFSKFGA